MPVPLTQRLCELFGARRRHHALGRADELGVTLCQRQLFTALAFWTNTLCPSEVQPANMQPQDAAREFIRRIAIATDDLDAFDALTGSN